MKLIIFFLLLFSTNVISLNIAAKGYFVKPFTAGSGISNNAKLSFSNTGPMNDPNFFILQNGEIKVIKTGKYFVAADCPFLGPAQMALYTNGVIISKTVVGQSESGTLSFQAIIDVESPNTLLSWRNPSGHSNIIPPPLNTYNIAKLVIFGIDFVDGSNPIPGYLELSRVADNFDALKGYNLENQKNIEEIYFGSQLKGFATEANVPYLVFYNFIPTFADQIVMNTVSGNGQFPFMNSGRDSGNTQQSGKGIVRTPLADLFYPVVKGGSFEVMEQNKNSGGNKVIYNSLVVLKLDGSYGEVYTLNPPSGPFNLISGNKLPLTTEGSESGINLSNNVIAVSSGTWLVGSVFNTIAPSAYSLKFDNILRLDTYTQSSGYDTQVGNLFLINIGDLAMSFEMLTDCSIQQSCGGSGVDAATPISVTLVKLSDL